ncbi:MAG: hypothetical protein JXB14_03625 [Candidatus Altiarchaeota archaeon]|nr:hypothetical protein [Candidatus Altiarchaeota archaeon]
MATALDSRYLCQSCGYVGHVVEKDAEKVERYVGRDLKKIKKDLRKP